MDNIHMQKLSSFHSRLTSLLLLTVFLILTVWINPVNAIEKLPSHLINLQSKPGISLLKQNANDVTVKLLSHFVTQKLPSYCGIASATMILNAVELPAPLDQDHHPHHYFNQDNFFDLAKIKEIINLNELQVKGITLQQLSDALNIYGLKTKIIYSNQINLKQMRTLIVNAIHHHQFVIADFYRAAIKQSGKGHYSPVAAYDKKSDRILILDVARYKYPPFWIKSKDLWAGIAYSENTDGHRGLLIVSA